MHGTVLLALMFQFAAPTAPVATMPKGPGVIVIGEAPTPQPDRRCSLPGEMQQCIDYCHAAGGIKKAPEPGWNPWDPRVLGTLKAALPPTVPNPFEQHLAVQSCDVHTVGGFMTLVCQCFDPGNVT